MRRTRRHRTKRKSLKIHATKRFEQRVGIPYSKRIHDCIVNKIQSGESNCVRTVSNTRTIHDVNIESRTIRIVYDKLRKTIVTVLPK